MAINRLGHAAAVLSLAACLCAASAFGAGSAHPASAEEAIAGALANVKSRYRAKLDHYGLTESYFDETSGICDLMLLDVQTWTKYQIAYYRATDEIVWPRMMPKGVAKESAGPGPRADFIFAAILPRFAQISAARSRLQTRSNISLNSFMNSLMSCILARSLSLRTADIV